MRSATISIPDDLDEALTAYGRDRGMDPEAGLEALVEVALREVLAFRGFLGPIRPLSITPLRGDDEGPTDVSINHDHYFAEWERSSWKE